MGGTLQFYCDKLLVDAQLKSTDCLRGILQPSYVYLKLSIKGASREAAINAIQSADCALSFPEIDEAIYRQQLTDLNEPAKLTAAVRHLIRENREKQAAFNMLTVELLSQPNELSCPSVALTTVGKEVLDLTMIGLVAADDDFNNSIDSFLNRAASYIEDSLVTKRPYI